MVSRAIFTPNTVAFGEYGSLPILSASTAHTVVLPGIDLTLANASAYVVMPTNAQIAEIEAFNPSSGSNAVVSQLWYVFAQDTDTADDIATFVQAVGFRRFVPPGFSDVEIRACPPHSRLVLWTDKGLNVRVHAHIAS